MYASPVYFSHPLVSLTPWDTKGSVKQCTNSFRAINLQSFKGHHWGYETNVSILFFIWGYITYHTTILQYLEVSPSPASPLFPLILLSQYQNNRRRKKKGQMKKQSIEMYVLIFRRAQPVPSLHNFHVCECV